MSRRPLIAGNWKMNGVKADGLRLAGGILATLGELPTAAEVLVCRPATLVDAVAQLAAGSALRVGGQDCAVETKGAHTGDIAALMLKDLGATYVIVGHSERRLDHGETDAIVQTQAAAAHAAGLTAIVCVGETGAERDAGQTLAVSSVRCAALCRPAPRRKTRCSPMSRSGPSARERRRRSPKRRRCTRPRALAGQLFGAATADRLRILYGGSIKPANALEFLAVADIGGALVGGASLNVDDFPAIVQSAPHHS